MNEQTGQPAHPMTNQQLADTFAMIADLLEIKGENIYKILAYRKAADSLANLSQPAFEVWQQGELTKLPGIGKAISEKIEELFTTGSLEFLEKLQAEVPPTLAELLQVPGLGSKKVALFWKELGITTLDELESAAEAGKLRALPGMGAKSEQKILASLRTFRQRSKRIPLGTAYAFARQVLRALEALPEVVRAEPAGSLRRMCDSVGDLDLLAASDKPDVVLAAFVSHPQVTEVVARGETKASVVYDNRLRAQLWVHPPERFGSAWQYATGSKDHNVRLRELARKRGLSLSEHGFEQEGKGEILCGTEEEVYATLGLPWIPPELREDRGEIEAALQGNLPKLIKRGDIIAELHTHSTWSDGKVSILEMAQAAIERGYKVLAITDHSQSLGVAGGVTAGDLLNQRAELDHVQRQLGDTIILLQGIEVEIRADGSLDFPDDVLASLDLVIASLHSGLRQSREQVTSRLLKAIRNPHVDIIGHPTGRKVVLREPADLDMEAVFRAAAETGTALEINAHPARLDLNDIHARRAVELGALLSLNTDAHVPDELDLLHFGVATARRGWVQAAHVINTWSPDVLLNWLKQPKGG